MSLKIYLSETVHEAALRRLRWLFSEFEHIYVSFSGGKDSTIVLNLALQVAEEMGRLPLPVVFIDQEAEWASVIDYIRTVMHDPRVKPYWLQMPIRIFNATSTEDPWLFCWEPGKEDVWCREREPDSIHVNDLGTDRFHQLFGAFLKARHPKEKCCTIAGVRAEESPARALGLTSNETYKGETWGKVEDKKIGHYSFYPIYDWKWTDVWKAIHDHGWPYCSLYDEMYRYGIPVPQMRVSNVHHETAVRTLFFLQEIEPETWERVTMRLRGVNTAKHLKWDFYAPKELPFMFSSWEEYRDHLLANLIADEKDKAWFARTFASTTELYKDNPQAYKDLLRCHIAMIMVNDKEGTKLSTFSASHLGMSKNRGVRSGRNMNNATRGTRR